MVKTLSLKHRWFNRLTLDPNKIWYKRRFHLFAVCLYPLSLVFYSLILLRRVMYRYRVLASTQLPVPVIIVGNISVGGTGKTPFLIWMGQQLIEQGYRIGIVTRGYKGTCRHWPILVNANHSAQYVGDEPYLIARRLQCPVAAGPKRVESAVLLLKHHKLDIILSDDGLQHYALNRDIEIAMIDGDRAMGNGLLLPAGPLREPTQRLHEVDFLISTGNPFVGAITMKRHPGQLYSVIDGSKKMELTELAGTTVHAIAGIGHPERFFQMLRLYGLNVIEHPHPDHCTYDLQDISFDDDLFVLMTEKDAVKCQAFAHSRLLCVPLRVVLPETFAKTLAKKVQELIDQYHNKNS